MVFEKQKGYPAINGFHAASWFFDNARLISSGEPSTQSIGDVFVAKANFFAVFQ